MYAEPRGADELRPQPHPIPHEPRQKERPTTRSAVWWGAPLYAVPRAGLEPARTCVHWCLRPTRLPIPPSGHRSVGSAKIRQFRLLYNMPRGLEGGATRRLRPLHLHETQLGEGLPPSSLPVLRAAASGKRSAPKTKLRLSLDQGEEQARS